jgi:hypothetical protein
MIPDRLPWRHRARPSATLHEIQVRFSVVTGKRTCSEDCYKSGGGRQVPIMLRHSFASGMPLRWDFFHDGERPKISRSFQTLFDSRIMGALAMSSGLLYVVPPGLGSPCWTIPGLTSWANICRRAAAGAGIASIAHFDRRVKIDGDNASKWSQRVSAIGLAAVLIFHLIVVALNAELN